MDSPQRTTVRLPPPSSLVRQRAGADSGNPRATPYCQASSMLGNEARAHMRTRFELATCKDQLLDLNRVASEFKEGYARLEESYARLAESYAQLKWAHAKLAERYNFLEWAISRQVRESCLLLPCSSITVHLGSMESVQEHRRGSSVRNWGDEM